MPSPPSPTTAQRLARAAAAIAVTVLLVAGARLNIPPENVCPDFIQFWTTASLLSKGQNPYDPALEASVQQGLGWNKAEEGLGIYDFLPYYYPPWLGFAFLPFLLLDYPVAKLVWLVLGAEFVLMAGFLLKDRVRGLSAGLAVAVTCLFGFSIKAVAMGQLAPLVLLLLAIAWTLLDRERDAAAGVVLALLTIKPQLTLMLITAVLCWAVRRRRWAVPLAFTAAFTLLLLASTLTFHGWFDAMLGATRVTPMPSAYFPGVGATMFVALGAVGVQGALLYVACGAAALATVVELARLTLLEDFPLEDVLAVSLIAPFFVVPYARGYDFPVLLVPILVLLGARLPPLLRAMLAFTLVVIAGEHILWISANAGAAVVGQRRPEFTYFWIPLLLALAWFGYGRRTGREEGSAILADRNGPQPNRRAT